MASAATAPRIFGGSVVPITDHPWQVAIVRHSVTSAWVGQFCGGVIVDARHVITAGHCLGVDFDHDGEFDPATDFDVVAGMPNLKATPGLPAQRIQIATWGGMPQFDVAANVSPYDAALVTLSQPLDTLAPGVRPAVLVGAGVPTPAGTPLNVSGWGTTEALPNGSPDLRSTDIFAVGDPDCSAFFDLSLTDEATMLCAVAPGKDSCSGDSGGPLTRADSTLVGLVSWGPQDCASADGAPGVYTELAEPTINSFVRGSTDVPYTPPQATASPTLTGTAKSGETLTCNPGSWTSTAPGAPEIEYRFGTADGQTIQNWSQATTYVVGANDGGLRIVCGERARDASGAAFAASDPSDPVVGPPPAVVPPVTTPVAQPVPGPAPAAKPVDSVAPRTTFLSISCRKRRCVVRVRVADRGTPTSGVKSVRITALPARGAVRTVTARKIARGIYEARFSRVSRGTAWFTVATRDVAGNRSPQPAIKHVRVR